MWDDMSITAKINDTIASLTGKLGILGKDKAASVAFTFTPIRYDELTSAYRGSWISRKIVDIPALDMFRRWRDWQAEASQIELIEAEEFRLGLKTKLAEAMRKARLYGGCAIYISTGETQVDIPLNVQTVKKNGIRFLNVFSIKDLTPENLITDPQSEYYNKPEFYRINSDSINLKIHASRLVIFKGAPIPDEDLPSVFGYGWGDSVLQACFDAIKQADSTAANVASLIFEAKVDVIKVPDLMLQIMDPKFEAELLKRFHLANTAKGLNSILILDAAEEYEQKNANFSQLSTLLQEFLAIVCGAADIPATRMLGQSPNGMNATGDGDLRNYYDRIQSHQNNEVGPAIHILDECLIRSALGTRPPEVHYSWASLWQINDKERIEIGDKAATMISRMVESGLYPQEALAKAGANFMVENAILPGFNEAIEAAGGFLDFEEIAAELEKSNASI
jgi:uncharacterized protein